VHSENGSQTDTFAEECGSRKRAIGSTESRIFTLRNPRESQAKKKGTRREREEARVMSQKIRSDRVTVKGKKKKRGRKEIYKRGERSIKNVLRIES
jgi:hypothetical protein